MRAVVLVAVLGLLASGCTGGGKPHASAVGGTPSVPGNLPDFSFSTPPSQLPFPVRDVTGQAKQASGTLTEMARTVHSWNVDCSVRDPLVAQLAIVDDSIQQGNLLGARSLLTAWTADAQGLAMRGMLPRAEGEEYQALAAKVASQLPDRGRVTPFTQSGAPRIPDNCPALASSAGPVKGYQHDAALYELLDSMRIALVAGLNLIPYVGGAIASLVGFIWDKAVQHTLGANLFDYLLAQIEKLMDMKLAEATVSALRKFLGNEHEGLQFLLSRYAAAVQYYCPDDPSCKGVSPEAAADINGAWKSAQDQMDVHRGLFRPDSEPASYLVLPDFSLFTNLDLTNMRDGIVNGKNWGLTSFWANHYEKAIPGITKTAVSYEKDNIPLGSDAHAGTFKCTRTPITIPGRGPGMACTMVSIGKFNWRNDYDQLMTLSVGDLAYNWPYFDPDKYKPDGSVDVPTDTRVIFSNASGTGAGIVAGDAVTEKEYRIEPDRTPRDPLTKILIYTDCAKPEGCPSGADGAVGPGSWVAGWALDFGDQSGPKYGPGSRYAGAWMHFGARPTGSAAIIRAYGFGATHQSAKANKFNVIELLGLQRANGQHVEVGDNTKNQNYDVSFPGEILSDIYSGGNSEKGERGPSSIAFGFRYADTSVPDLNSYVTSPGAKKVSVINTATDKVDGTIDVPDPTGVAVAPDGRHAYVANRGQGTLSVIDTAEKTVVKTIQVGMLPSGVAVAPDGRHVYVANQLTGTVSVIDTATDTVVKTIHNLFDPLAVAVTPDGGHLYVTSRGSQVSVIDTSTGAVVKKIDVGNYSTGVAVAPDGSRAYVTNRSSNTVSVIDTSTNAVIKTIDGLSSPEGVAVTPDGDHAYVAINNRVAVIDTSTNTVVKKTLLNAQPGLGVPTGVSVTPDGGLVYVTSRDSNPGRVSVIATATNEVDATIDVSPGANGVAMSP